MPLGNRPHSAPPAQQKEKRENGGTIRPPKPEWGPKKYLYSGKVNLGGEEWNMYLFPPSSPGDYYNVSFTKPQDNEIQRRPAYRRPPENYHYDQPPTAPNTSRGYREDRDANPPGRLYDERNPPPRGDEPF